MVINIFIFIFSLIIFLFSPVEYNFYFILLVSVVFLFQVFNFSFSVSKLNYINFYNLFFLSYFFINFFYPLVLYPIDPEYFSIFSKKFNHDFICRATAIAQVVSSSLILGASLGYRKINKDKISDRLTYLNHLPITYTSFFLFFCFILTVGKDFLSGNFTAQSSLSLYILPLVSCSYTLATIIFFRDYKYQTRKNIFYISIILYIFLFLSVGDRGPALSTILIIFGLYSSYINKIKLFQIIPISIFGIFLMRLVGEGRVSGEISDEGNIISRGLESIEFNVDGYYNMTLDFVINSWTLYIGVEYSDINGIDWGSTFLKPLLGVFPFLQGLVESTGLVRLTSPSEIFTNIGLGNDPTWGLGTNLISSVYIAYGLIGCIILFFTLGFIVEKFRVNSYIKGNIFSHIVYFSLLGYAVYYPRTDFLMPLKFIVWTCVIYIILTNFKLLKAKYK